LTDLDISNWNLSKITDLSGAFGECPKITNLTVVEN
jgi:surface protein